MRITNLTKNTTIAINAKVAKSFQDRLVGLLKHSALLQGEALIITHCQQIHMFFMKFAIDAIFVSRKQKVVGIVENILPGHISPIFFNANYCIELPVGSIASSQTTVGDLLKNDPPFN